MNRGQGIETKDLRYCYDRLYYIVSGSLERLEGLATGAVVCLVRAW